MTSSASVPAPATEVLAVSELPGGGVRHATAVRAGGFVFATGATTLDYAPAADPAGARWPRPPYLAEAAGVLAGVLDALATVGCGPEHTLRIDQFYPRDGSIDDYQLARRAALNGNIPCSTSIIVEQLLSPHAHCDVSLVAALPGDALPERIFPDGLDVPAWAGFAPVMRHGDWVFVAGQMADGDDHGLDPRVANWPYHHWGTRQVTRQTEVLAERLKVALEGAGSSFESLVKAQAYVADASDVPYFLDVWDRIVGVDRCALTVVPGTAFNVVQGAVEVTVMAVRDSARDRVERIDAPIAGAGYGPAAIRFDDLLLPSGLIAPADPGRAERAERLRHVGGAAEEMTALLDDLATICAAAGTSLGHVVRAQQFHGDLADFQTSQQVWSEALDGAPVPFSALGTQAPPVAGATTTLDAWVHVPSAEPA